MATTVQNSDKKYLNFSGLAYYDGKIKAWVEGKKYITNDALAGYATESFVNQNYQPKGNYQAAGNYIVDNDGSLVQKINTSYTYWTNFLSGLTTPAPTLAELSADHTWLTDNKSGLESASSWVSTNGANVLGDHTWLTTNKSGLESASSWVSTNGANVLGDHTWLTTNKSGLESASSWVSTNGANVLDSIKDLCGDPTATGDAKLGRVGVLEQQIGKLTKATSWLGVVTAKPTGATVTVNGVSTTCAAGDIVTVVNDNAAETGLEYIFDGTNWVELGDSSGSRTRLTTLEGKVNDIQANYVLKSEIVFATTAEIDTLFA